MLKSLAKQLFVPALLLVGSLLFSFDSFGSASTTTREWELARDEPLQTPLSPQESASPITLEAIDGAWRVFPRANYRVAARVLQNTWYDDWQASFAPLDLALGWGEMSEPRVDRWIEWRQSERWYYYRLQQPPILRNLLSPLSADYVREHSANVHVIPASERVENALRTLQRNSLILIEGKLVDVEVEKDGAIQRFTTSLSRLDGGDGSCEIMYVERVVMQNDGYR